MSSKNWNVSAGLFSSAYSWSPSEAPVAGDNLYIKSGMPFLFNETFGSSDVRTTIGLTGPTAANSPQIVAYNVILKNVDINNALPPYTGQVPSDYYSAKHGRLLVGGTVTNDGGTIFAKNNIGLAGGNSIDITVAPGSTLINKGTLGSGPGSSMTIAGYGGSSVENDGKISTNGTVIISTHLTGTGDVSAQGGAGGGQYGSRVEINAAVDAGQTVILRRAILQLDQPPSFLGQVDADSSGLGTKVNLEGLPATSWDVNGSSLEFFDTVGNIVDTLRFTTPQDPRALAVTVATDPTYGSVITVGTGVFFGTPPAGSVLLPYHTAAAA